MILRLIEEGIAAGIGTIAFALMFHVPKQYYLCGVWRERPAGLSTGLSSST